MKKVIVLSALAFIFSINILGQAKLDFSGKWVLDTAKSKMPSEMSFKSMTKTVKQTKSNIKIRTQIETNPSNKPPILPIPILTKSNNSLSGENVDIYTLDGNEKNAVLEATPLQPIPITRKGSIKSDDRLELVTSIKFHFPNEVKTTTMTETWELAENGKMLKINLVVKSLSDNKDTSLEWIFNRKIK